MVELSDSPFGPPLSGLTFYCPFRDPDRKGLTEGVGLPRPQAGVQGDTTLTSCRLDASLLSANGGDLGPFAIADSAAFEASDGYK